MEKELDCKVKSEAHCAGTSSAVYGLGFIGAVIYYVSQATGFWIGTLGVLKSMVWPAFLVYEVLKYVGA